MVWQRDYRFEKETPGLEARERLFKVLYEKPVINLNACLECNQECVSGGKCEYDSSINNQGGQE